jgi:GAF domain-containing protein
MRPGFTTATPEPPKPANFWQRLIEPHPSLTEIGARHQARLIIIVALILTATNSIGALTSFLSTGEASAALVLLGLAFFSGIGYGLARRRHYRIGGYLIVWLLTASAFSNPSGAETISNSLYVYLIVAIVFASISFPFRYMLFYVVFCIVSIPLLSFVYPEYRNVGFDLAIFFPFGALMVISMRYRDTVERDRLAEVTAINKELEEVRNSLEIRVEDRTRQLEGQSLRLRVVAEIARDAASARDVSELLERGAQLIQDRFNYYQTGIYLLDGNREFAVLTASPTEAGRQMIANGFKLRVGETGIVGRVASSGEPRISLDTGLDAIYFNNPLLPNTRSEMALPLKVENRMLGVLDVQSDQPQAFNEEDSTIMQVLADQLAIAIERTQLFQQVEANLTELQQAYGRSTREGWKVLAESGLLSNAGYRFDNMRIQPINTTPELGMEAMQSGQMIVKGGHGDNSTGQTLAAIPVKLRGQSIGVVTVRLKEGHSSATVNTIEQAVERLSASLESARLFEEARLRADREQAISQVTTAISAASEFDSILKTTVEEIGKSLGDSEVTIQLM